VDLWPRYVKRVFHPKQIFIKCRILDQAAAERRRAEKSLPASHLLPDFSDFGQLMECCDRSEKIFDSMHLRGSELIGEP
jgi:hypothetical protein